MLTRRTTPTMPHLIQTLQRVVDEVSLPVWMPGQCSGTTPMLVWGPSRPRAGAPAAPTTKVEVYPTHYGDVTQVVVPPKVNVTIQALGYHHLGDLYTQDHRIVGERALKERAPTHKGIPGLQVWLAHHSAVLVPLLRAPTLRRQAAPKDWIPGVVPTYSAEAVVMGWAAKTTKEETVYHKGYAVKVFTAMKTTMEAECWAPEFRVCCEPPDAMPSNTRWHRLLVALLGVQVPVNAPLHTRLWEDHQHVSLGHLWVTGVLALAGVWLSGPPTAAY